MATPSGNVRVVCRFRPLNERERTSGDGGAALAVQFTSDVSVAMNSHSELSSMGTELAPKHAFTFDTVLPPGSSQEDVFENVGRVTARDVMRGYNGTVFAYGQTAAGKTYTMEGPSVDDAVHRGLVPRMVDVLFDEVAEAPENMEFTIKVAMVEIYMEKIRDLLDATKVNLRVREDKSRGVWIDGVTERYVASPEEVLAILKAGQVNRAVGATKMNIESSRSHSVFIVTVEQKDVTTGSQKTGKLYLVDLAGSEKIDKTGATGTTLDEAKMINRSLSALGNVIKALTDGKSTHIPYRDSKLTRILQESLGGNSRTTLIINCSPAAFNAQETLSTLRFGNRAKAIKNAAKINEEKSVSELKSLLARAEKEVSQLKEMMASGMGAGEGGLKALPEVAELHETISDLEERIKALEEENQDYAALSEHLQEALKTERARLQEATVKSVAMLEEFKAEMESIQQRHQESAKENELLVIKLADATFKQEKMEYDNKELALTIDKYVQSNEALKAELEEAQAVADRATIDAGPQGDSASSTPRPPAQGGETGSAPTSPAQQAERESAELEALRSQIDDMNNTIAGLQGALDESREALQVAQETQETGEANSSVLNLTTASAKMEALGLEEQEPSSEDPELVRQVIEDASFMEELPSTDSPDELKAHIKVQREQLAKLSGVAHGQQSRLDKLEESYKKSLEFIRSTEHLWSAEEGAVGAVGKESGADVAELQSKLATQTKEFDALKAALLADLQHRCERVVELEMALEDAQEQVSKLMRGSATKPLQKKVLFLERNLEQLAHVHHQVVNQNSALSIEKQVGEKKIAFQNDRIKYLEQLLKDAHEKLFAQAEAHEGELGKVKESLDVERREREEEVARLNALVESAQAGGGRRIHKPLRGGGT